jgi:hypothetical protein
MAIPGVGPVVAAGWLVSTLQAQRVEPWRESVVGALTQAGVSKADADIHAEGLLRGGAVSIRAKRVHCLQQCGARTA